MKCTVDIVNKMYHKANSKCAKIWFKDNIQEIEMHSVMDGFKPCNKCYSMKCNLELFREVNNTDLSDCIVETDVGENNMLIIKCIYTSWIVMYCNNYQDFALFKYGSTSKFTMTRAITLARYYSDILNFIKSEEEKEKRKEELRIKLSEYPDCYGGQAFSIIGTARKYGFKAEIDGYNTYVITDLAAWKITYDEDEDDFVLYHSPFSEPDKTIELEEAKTAKYHLQKDAIRYHTPQGYIEYIKGHENDRKLENIDYRLMFHDSIRQKKYYNQAKRRYELRSINNTLKLISKLETKGEFKARRKVDG